MRMHGLNERISVENMIEGLRGTEGIIRAIAAYDPG